MIDTDALWMPFTPNRAFKDKPRIVREARGMRLVTQEGRDVIDATAGLWCSNLGHCRPEISRAVKEQLDTLDFTSVFNFGHELAFDYARRLVAYTPAGLDHVFFGNSGSEAVETALKLALQYWQALGKNQKTRFIGRELGYHGVNFGGISVGGIPSNAAAFGQWLMVDHLRHTHDLERSAFSRGQPESGAELAEELEQLLLRHGAETVAAVIVEPVAGAGGVIVPPEGYLERLREICTEHDVLLIFDEVITGWGRVGAPFAATRFGVTPDLMTSAKGITNAAVPLSAVFISNELYRPCMERARTPVEFFHGYTYSCHPVGCAAGMAALDIYEAEGLLARAAGPLATYWEDALHSLRDVEGVVDIRNFGLLGAVQHRGDAASPGTIGARLQAVAWELGLMVRAVGDSLCLSPPLIVEEADIDEIRDKLRRTLESVPLTA